MTISRIRNNATNDGVVYTTQDNREINIKIDNYNSSYADTGHENYHQYTESSEIFQSDTIADKIIIERNFREEPAPTFGLINNTKPIENGDVSSIAVLGSVKHYIVESENIIVNVTENGHRLAPVSWLGNYI